jgi:hypothetical protein
MSTFPYNLQNITRIWGDVGQTGGRPLQRFWDSGDVQNAIAVASFAQMDPVIEKLESGQPITVAAVGSSVTGDFGGVFHSSLDEIFRCVTTPHALRRALEL